MQIIVPQDEIASAVEMLVRSQISLKDNQEISVEFTNVRSPNGMTAEVTITTLKNASRLAADAAVKSLPVETVKAAPEIPVSSKASIFKSNPTSVNAPAETADAESEAEAPTEEEDTKTEEAPADEPEAAVDADAVEEVAEKIEEAAGEASKPATTSARSIFSKTR